jgi:hypothetical protein
LILYLLPLDPGSKPPVNFSKNVAAITDKTNIGMHDGQIMLTSERNSLGAPMPVRPVASALNAAEMLK